MGKIKIEYLKVILLKYIKDIWVIIMEKILNKNWLNKKCKYYIYYEVY